MDNPNEPQLRHQIKLLLKEYPGAILFLEIYNQYVHCIDDLVDEAAFRNDPENILRMANLASACFSTDFWRQNAHILLPIEQMANNTYADSIVWERSPDEKKKVAADTLRHSGLDIYLKTVEICCGREALRELSPLIREHTLIIQTDEPNKQT